MRLWPFRTRSEARGATLSAPPDWLIQALTNGSETYSGKSVTPESSMGLVPVWAAVSLIAGAVAQLPLIVYRRGAEGARERADDTRQWELLHEKPNAEMASDELFELITGHLLLWGNAFLAKQRGGDGRVAELWPIKPSRVLVGRSQGEKVFTVDGAGPYTDYDILHLRGLGYDGVVGLSPIQQARQALGNALALDEFQGNFWANGTMVSGFLRHPNTLSQEAAERLGTAWRSRFSGVSNAGKLVVLEEDMEWQTAGMPLRDAEFVASAKLSDLRAAQIFLIPPHMLGAPTGDSMTYKNVESEGIDFIRRCVGRWLVRIENSLLRDDSLFPKALKLYPEFLVDALLRADAKTRAETYAIATGGKPWMHAGSEVRPLENLSPDPELDAAPPPTSSAAPSPSSVSVSE